MSPIAWVDGAPSSHGEPEIPFFSAPSHKCFVRAIGGFRKALTHFCGKTLPCLGSDCANCRNGVQAKVSVFLGALLYSGVDNNQKAIWDQVIWHFPDRVLHRLGDVPYRGFLFSTWLSGASPNRRIMIERTPKPAIELDHAPLDIEHLLHMKWRIPKAESQPIHVYDGGDLPEVQGGAA